VSAATSETKRRRAMWHILLLTAGFLVLVAISAASVLFVNKAREDNSWVVHTIEVENQTNTLLLEVRRAEGSARGYLVTSDADFRTDYEQAAAAIPAELDQLSYLTGDNPTQVANIGKLRAAIQARLDEFAQEMELVKSGGPTSIAALVRRSTANDTSSTIRDVSNAMLAEENRLFALRTTSADRSQRLASTITIAGSGLVLVLAGISIFLLRRSGRERDDAEARLRDNNVNLEATVDERTADLREANEEIQRFAYIVSHDLRSPLVNIMGFTSELEELRGDIFRRLASLSRDELSTPPRALVPNETVPELEGEDRRLSHEFSEALGFIKSSIAKMDRLITAILNLTREGRRKFEPTRIDVHELIEAIVSTLAHQLSEANAKVDIAPLPHLTSDRLALEQIFSNLIDNAIKYHRPGVPGKISIRARTKLGFAVFEVADNGRGIDRKDHQRIFDLFRRAGTQDTPGQGIGLAHVRALVRRLGGTMSVSSELGQGSTFTIMLPLKWSASRENEDT
jgi:signal transduction histidine kinase